MNSHQEADFKQFFLFLLSQHVPKYLLRTSKQSQISAPHHGDVSSVSGGKLAAATSHDCGSFCALQFSLLLCAADTGTRGKRKRKSATWASTEHRQTDRQTENDAKLLDQMLLPEVTKRWQCCVSSLGKSLPEEQPKNRPGLQPAGAISGWLLGSFWSRRTILPGWQLQVQYLDFLRRQDRGRHR